MSIAEPTETTVDGPDAESLMERVFAAVLGAQEVQAIFLGYKLGWYQALADHGPLSSVELADRTSSAERYAREWLEHQAVCGYLDVAEDDPVPTARRFALPAAHAEVLIDRDSLLYAAPLARMTAGLGQHLGTIAEAYRTGRGVSWAELGQDARESQADANRPLFLHALGQELIPQVEDLHAVLTDGARVADIGCGAGWSSIGLARSYPTATVVGFDRDEPSIEMARRHAAALGVADRVRFEAAAASTVDGTFDVVFAFECIHDMSDPVGALAAMRGLAGDDGTVVVMDERVPDQFAPNGDEVERLLYGYSLTCCLPDGMSEHPSAGTGTVMRASTLTDYAIKAGFQGVEILPIENDFFRFYRLELPQ
jgi:methylase of polypeptide subunit release factors